MLLQHFGPTRFRGVRSQPPCQHGLLLLLVHVTSNSLQCGATLRLVNHYWVFDPSSLLRESRAHESGINLSCRFCTFNSRLEVFYKHLFSLRGLLSQAPCHLSPRSSVRLSSGRRLAARCMYHNQRGVTNPKRLCSDKRGERFRPSFSHELHIVSKWVRFFHQGGRMSTKDFGLNQHVALRTF